jgi:hypothetical protein
VTGVYRGRRNAGSFLAGLPVFFHPWRMNVMTMKQFSKKFARAIEIIVQVHREKASGIIEFELKELENIFSLLILGGFIGMPSPPVPIAIELLPYMERELTIMLARTDMAQDPLAPLLGILDVD